MKMYVKKETAHITKNYIYKKMKIKINTLEMCLGAIILGTILNEPDYLVFGICLYQNYYQK